MTTTSDNVYKTIGKLAGINVLFDLDYRPQRINIELDEVPLREAAADGCPCNRRPFGDPYRPRPSL